MDNNSLINLTVIIISELIRGKKGTNNTLAVSYRIIYFRAELDATHTT